MSNLLSLNKHRIDKGLWPHATTAIDQYQELNVKAQLSYCNTEFEMAEVGYNKRSLVVPYNEFYQWDVAAYRRLLKSFIETEVEKALWRFCGLRGVVEIIIPTGRYVLELTEREDILDQEDDGPGFASDDIPF